MKKGILDSLLFILLISLSVVFTACEKLGSKDNMNNSPGTVAAVNAGPEKTDKLYNSPVILWNNDKDYSYSDREQFRKSVIEALNKLDVRVIYMRDKANNTSNEAKVKATRKIDDLIIHRNQITGRMDDWNRITESKWEDFKSDITYSWENITEDITSL